MDPLYLYAYWKITSQAITFRIVGPDGVPTDELEVTVLYGDRLHRPNPGDFNIPIPSDCYLDGWYVDNGAKGGLDTWHTIEKWNFDKTVKDSGDLFARLIKLADADYSVTFEYGSPIGGLPVNFPAETELTQYVLENDFAVEPFMPASVGSTSNFVGWYDASTGGEQFKFNTPITGDITLYARWVESVTGMVWVPRGEFVMGDSNVSGKTPDYNSYPSKVVMLDGFFISETETTQQQWEAWAGAGSNPGAFSGSNLPVEGVTWAQANAYAAANGSRLPKEAEWEYAARGGHYGLQMEKNTYYLYAGSDNPKDVAWYNETVKPPLALGTQPVDGKAANKLGIYGMSGNVAEWCDDLFVPYGSGAAGTDRVIRGGSWSSAAGNVRNVTRNSQDPAKASWDVGFRVVCDPVGIY